MESIPHKPCSKCHIDQPLTEYYKNNRHTDKHNSICKRCGLDAVRAYQARNRDRVLARNKEYRETHREQRLASHKRYNRTHKAPPRRNGFRPRTNGRRFVIPPHLRIDRSHREYSEEDWTILRVALGDVCLRCGTDAGLTIDHVIPIALGGLDHITNVQPLCGPCNSAKHISILDLRDPGRLAIALVLVHQSRTQQP